jgi:hypothetical protein
MTRPNVDAYKAANQARWSAIRQLIASHQDEYDQTYRNERENRGLPPVGTNDGHYWQNRVAALEAKLREQGINPTIT